MLQPEFCEIFKSTFLYRMPLVAASELDKIYFLKTAKGSLGKIFNVKKTGFKPF